MTRHVEVDDELWDEFHRVVNMMSRELMDWLRTRSAVEDAEELPDQACTKTGPRVLEKLQKRGGPHRQRRARDAQGSSTGFTPNAATTSSRPPVRELATPADDHRSRSAQACALTLPRTCAKYRRKSGRETHTLAGRGG
jgi:hypothetical protein